MRTSQSLPADRGARVLFCIAAMVALAFALYTNHCWEDYYITFRTSKNLVTGHGLVYQVGERVHTFTSPLGVLLPAFTSWVSGGKSDTMAFWLFRFISIAAFAGAVSLVWKAGRAWGWRISTCVLTAAFAMTDAKSVSFTINGMETGILLFFLALCVAVFAIGPRRSVGWLGAAWAGLMWTRPDSFVYIAAIGVGFWLFLPGQKLAPSRAKLLLAYLKSGLVCTALYGPWLLWAWWYYGSPIPNTIVAKGTGHKIPAWTSLLADFLVLPYRSWHYRFASGIFMPSYFGSGGWPGWCVAVCGVLAVAALIAFVLPRLRVETRALSVATFIGMFYVTNTEMYPWYFPAVTFLAILTLGGLGESLLGALAAVRRTGRIWLLPGAAVVLFSSGLLAESARQLKWQQEIIEGQRREIGLWLRANRQSNQDTVFLEPLGYIGYFSQLKMLDYPGMSSPEVIAARKKVGENWVDLIGYLKPQWLILRPQEIHVYHLDSQPWFLAHYKMATVFDVRDKINALRTLPCWSYLQWDETFYIYHRDEETPDPAASPE